MRELDNQICQYFHVFLRLSKIYMVTSLSILETALPRNNKTKRSLANVNCSQKELFDAVEYELAGSFDNVGCIVISNDIKYRRQNVRKTAQEKDPEDTEPKKRR